MGSTGRESGGLVQGLAQLQSLVSREVGGERDAFVDLLQRVHVLRKRSVRMGGRAGWVTGEVEPV